MSNLLAARHMCDCYGKSTAENVSVMPNVDHQRRCGFQKVFQRGGSKLLHRQPHCVRRTNTRVRRQHGHFAENLAAELCQELSDDTVPSRVSGWL